jgi:hypothetical protein
MDEKVKEISERIYRRSEYMNCLIAHREKAVKAILERDLCALWEIFDECKVPCRDRWDIVEFIMEKAKDPRGPHFW